MSDENVPILFSKFDTNNDGTMSYDEFLSVVRGKLSPVRSQIIRQVYKALSDRCGGTLTIDYVKKVYKAEKHMDVILGSRTADNVLVEFIETFEAHHNLGEGDIYVTLEEWEDYFHSASAIVDDDKTFNDNMKNVFDVKISESAQQQQYARKTGADPSEDAYWQNPQSEMRDPAKPILVQRSGLSSKDNPLNTTEEYYPRVNNAGRPSAQTMYSTPPIVAPEPLPKGEYAQFKNKPVKADFLKVQDVGKTVPKYQSILVERFRKALRDRGGRGISGLSRQFKIFDDNGNGQLEKTEFIKAIKDYQVQIEEIDLDNLFKTMDIDSSGTIDFNEFIRVIVGEMSTIR